MYREQAAVDRGDYAAAEALLGDIEKLRCAVDAASPLVDPITSPLLVRSDEVPAGQALSLGKGLAVSEHPCGSVGDVYRSIDAGNDPAILPCEPPSVSLWINKESNCSCTHSLLLQLHVCGGRCHEWKSG